MWAKWEAEVESVVTYGLPLQILTLKHTELTLWEDLWITKQSLFLVYEW